MSRRSILLTTAMCMALASTAAIAPASAHGGGGGSGGGGSFHSAGSGNFAPAHTGTMHVRKDGNGPVPAPIYTGSIVPNPKGQKIPASAFPPVDPSPNLPVGPAPTVLNKPVGPGEKVNKGAPPPWLYVPSVPY